MILMDTLPPLPFTPPPVRHYRQTVLLTSWVSADMNRLLSSSLAAGGCCSNHAGSIRVVPEHHGVLGAVVPQVCQE